MVNNRQTVRINGNWFVVHDGYTTADRLLTWHEAWNYASPEYDCTGVGKRKTTLSPEPPDGNNGE